MKNVLRRAIELLNLLSDNENLTTENIKDSISDYRDLNQQAFRRSFERDKNLLRSFGYLIQYENDKWSYDKGYSLSGYSIYESIIKSDKISSEKLINTYLYLKKYLSNSNYDNDKSEIISKILQSINEKRRVGFDYLDKYRKVKPQGLKYFDNKWYLAGEENGSLKTFNLDQIHNLKIGNKADLFQIENKNFPFSWDDEKYSIEATIKLKKDLYDVNKNIFAHNQTQLEIKDEFLHCNVSTNDSYGFIKFLLLLDDEIEIIKINSTVNLKELLDVKKIDLQLVMSALSLIQNKEKWNINKLVQKLNISEKDLFYILSVITDIYSQQGELLIDYEYDDKNQELLFNFNPSLKNIIQINDGELFNLVFLLTSNSIFKELVKNNSDIEEFYNVVSPYFNLEILDESNDGVFENLTFFEENIISYIKLGSTEETFYRIQPILLTTNTDGIVLEAIDLNEEKSKTFLINRIVDSLSIEDFRESKKSNNMEVVMKFTYLNEKVLTDINKDDYQLKNKHVEAKFYSELNAINFAIKNYENIDIISPQFITNELKNRNDKLKKEIKDMSLIELTIIIFISLGILDKDKIGKFFRVFNSSNSDQVRKVIGDETIEQKWVWLEEE